MLEFYKLFQTFLRKEIEVQRDSITMKVSRQYVFSSRMKRIRKCLVKD